MALTPSSMLPLDTEAPPFALTDVVSGRVVSRDDFSGRPLLMMFICNHCPFVIHVRDELARLGRDHADGPLAVVGVCSNDPTTHPDDAPEAMKKEAETAGYVFPYLVDETQEVAKSYRAACTPDFFLFDPAHRLRYRGQLDGSRPSNEVPVDGADLRAAIAAVLAGESPAGEQKPSLGCNIKWAPGNEPVQG